MVPFHPVFGYTSKLAVDTSAGPLRGRPYVGAPIMWRKSAMSRVSVVECKSVSLAAIKGCDSRVHAFNILGIHENLEDL